MSGLNGTLIEQLGLTLLHFIWQGTLIGLLYWLSLALWQPARASTRYNLAVATLFTLGLTPVLTFLHLGASSAASSGPGMAQTSVLLEVLLPATSGSHGASQLLASTVAAWLAGVLLLSLRLALGWHYVLQLRRSARRSALAHLKPLLEQLRQRMAIGKSVGLAVSDRVRSPVVVGWLKPLILFPPALVNRLPGDQLEMILAHELAHIRRHDHLVNLIQTLIDTVLFYHPVVAMVSRRVRIERENACDDLAVEVTGNRLVYVEMLASLERLRLPGARLALGVQDGQILGRIRRLVERSRPERQRGLTLAAVLGVLMAAGASGLWLIPEPDSEPDSYSATVDPGEPAEFEEPREPTIAALPPERALFSLPELEAPPTITAVDSDRREQTDPVESGERASTSGSDARSAADLAAPSQPPIRETAGEPLESPASEASMPAVSESRDDSSSEQPRSAASSALELAMAAPARPDTGATERPGTVSLTPAPLSGGELVDRVEPEFPQSARRRSVKGLVELEFVVDRRGQVQGIEVIAEQPSGWKFAQAARSAVSQWRFDPYRRDDEPVERRVRVEFAFDPADACEVYTGSRLPRC